MANKIIDKKRAFSTAGAAYRLDEDLMQGLKVAVGNSQTRLALEYLLHIAVLQDERIRELESRLPANREFTETDKQVVEVEVPAAIDEAKKSTTRKKEAATDGASE